MKPLEIIEKTTDALRGEYKAGIIMHEQDNTCYFQYYGDESQLIEAIANV